VTEQRGQLTPEQVRVLLQPIRPSRVYKAQGQSHVAAFDVTAHLNRVFGFDGWDKEVVALDLVHEHLAGEPPKVRAWVTYRCVMRLTVRDPDGRVVKVVEEAATGSASNMPTVGDAHDFAVKNAISYALKRCAKDLGDQFGLSLYDRGSVAPLVGKTLVTREAEPPAGEVPLDEHVAVVDEGTDGAPDPAVQALDDDDPTDRGLVRVPSPEEREAAARQRGKKRAAEAREVARSGSAAGTRTDAGTPATDASSGASSDTDPHPLDLILAAVDQRPMRARSVLLREALEIAHEQGLTVSIGWDDLRDGPIRDALLARYAGGAA
jgi:hypothetical protein